jgi:EAL and modified HD-GYP domain-containing signal transduction protein
MLGNRLRIIKGETERKSPQTPAIAASPSARVDQDRSQRFLTRQPILDTQSKVVGYELRLRGSVPVPVIPGAESRQQMEDEMLLVSAADLDFQKVLGNRRIFLSVSPATLFNPLVEQMPADQVVLAFEPPAHPDEALADRCQALAQMGIALTLDLGGDLAGCATLLPHCRCVRLDIGSLDAIGLGIQLDRIGELRRQTQLIATGVDTEETFQASRKLGFELFQGYHFTQLRPALPSQMDSSRVRVMELLNLVMSNTELPDLEARFKTDATLSYKLLRFINSAAMGMRQPIQSIGHALVILGYDQLYRWLTLLLFVSGHTDPRSQTLLKNALVRARFTENLGQSRFKADQRGGLFIVGILSLLDALLNQPMEQALADLNLPNDVTDALLKREGPYAPYLDLAIACENYDQDSIERLAQDNRLGADAVNLAHVNALIWAEGLEV